MTDAGAALVRARTWRRVAATAADWVFYACASAPGMLILGVSTSTGMSVAGGLLLVLPFTAHFTVFAALGNTAGGWLIGVRVMRSSTTQVGAAGHMLRWWVMGFQLWVVGLVAFVIGLPLRAVIDRELGEAFATGVDAVLLAAFVGLNLWLMGRGNGQTTWDQLLGTHVARVRRPARAGAGPAVAEA